MEILRIRKLFQNTYKRILICHSHRLTGNTERSVLKKDPSVDPKVGFKFKRSPDSRPHNPAKLLPVR